MLVPPGEALARLVALPHRGSATPQEAEAADRLEAYLRERGHAVERQVFLAPRTYGWELLTISLLLAAGGLLRSPLLGLAGTLWFWAYFSGWWTPPLFDHHASENLLARAGAGPRTLVVVAHYDTAKSFVLYHPALVGRFRATFVLTAALALLVVPLLLAWRPAAALVGLYFLAQAALLVHRELTAPYVNGANDNASGVEVATRLFCDLSAAVPEGWQVVLALTGSEEVGARGARALVRAGAVPRDALILNIDNVGAGRLCYATGEGMLRYRAFHGPLVAAARATPGAEAVRYVLAYFDTLPFARAGWACLTVVRLAGGVPAHWHWPTDTAAHLDRGAIEETYAYARRLVERLVTA